MNRCPSCNFEASGYTKFPRGHDNGDGTFTVLTKEQIEEAKVEKVLTITLDLTRHETSEVLRNTVQAGKAYYLVPSEASEADYPLFPELVRRGQVPDEDGKIWTYCTMFALRTVATPWRFDVLGDVLMMYELADPSTVKERPKVQAFGAVDLNDELEMAQMLVKKITEPFDPVRYVDSRKDKIAAMLAEAQAEQGGVVDGVAIAAGKSSLMAALKASVDAASGGPTLVAPNAKPVPRPRKAAAEVSDPDGILTGTTDVAVAAPKRTRAKKSA